MAKLTFKEDLCKGCGLCVNACPKHILELSTSHLNKKGYAPVTLAKPDECIGCGICVDACPQEVLEVPGGVAEVVNEDACIACGECLEECPMGAITEIAED